MQWENYYNILEKSFKNVNQNCKIMCSYAEEKQTKVK